MQHQSSTSRVRLREKLTRILGEMRQPIGHLCSGALGFLFAATSSPLGIAPFGAAWVSSQDDYIISAGLGAILGYFISADPGVTMRSVAAIALLVGLRWVFLASGRRSTVTAISPVIAAIAVGVTHLAVFLSGASSGLYVVLSALAEMVLTAGAGYFFIRTGMVIKNKGGVLRQSDYICISISSCIVASALMQINAGDFSPGRIISVLAIFICGYYGGAGSGAVVGIVMGAAAALSGSPTLMAPYAIGGLCAAVFAPTGRLMSAAAFAVVGGISGVMSGGGSIAINSIVETAAASLIFLFLPSNPGFVAPLKTAVRAGDSAISAQLAGQRLFRAAGALTDIAEITEKVAGELDALSGDDIEKVFAEVAESVCRKCRQSPRCWQSGYTDTMSALSQAGAVLRSGGMLAPSTLPDTLRRVCIHPDQMTAALNKKLGEYTGRQNIRRQAHRMRSIVNDQFVGMSMLLEGIREELSGVRPGGKTTQAAVEQYFAGLDIDPVSAICYEDGDGRQIVDVSFPQYKLGRVSETDAALAISEICEEKMGLPEILHNGDMAELIFAPVAEYSPTFAYVQRAAGGSRLCGDSFTSWSDRLGGASMVLSDGMGAGGAAAVDSMLTTTLISRLMSAGSRFDAALRMVNSALLVKSPDESLTTIDACEIDLYTGRANFYKAGAAPTFIIRAGKVAVIESTSLPAGILRGVAFEESSIALSPGDRIIMVSDGVTATGSEWVPSELNMLRELSDEELCEKLIETAEARLSGEREDDMTVAIMTLARSI